MNVSLVAKSVLIGAVLWTGASAHALLPAPDGLRVTPYYTTAHVRWRDVSDASVAGYEVYRRTASGSYGSTPIKRVLVRTDFTDYDLSPGQTYYYKVVAIDGAGNEVSDMSVEVSGTLASTGAGLSSHKNFELLVVIYKSGFTDAEVEGFKNGIRAGMLFYWKTTGCVFNFDPTFMIIDGAAPGSSWYSAALQNDLRARGVQNDQYDLGFLVATDAGGCYGGYVVFGSMCGALGYVCGVPYPDEANASFNTTVIWTFTHEIHHALEAMENRTSGTPEVIFCHFSDAYPNDVGSAVGWVVDMGPHFGGIAATNRDYGDQWFTFPAPYDGYLECVDADGDGMPDNDRRVHKSERYFGSDDSKIDTDGDGLTDLEEFGMYKFRDLDPANPDTDGDGIEDGNDPTPLYDVKQNGIPYMQTPTIDGVIEPNWPVFTTDYYYTQTTLPLSVRTYVGWNEDGIYVAVESTREMVARISLDGSPAYGRWESDVRHVDGDPDTSINSNDVNNIGDIWDDGRHLLAIPGNPLVAVAGAADIAGSELVASTGGFGYILEMKIPRVLPGGAGHIWYPLGAPVVDGLRLAAGRELGINMVLAEDDGADWLGLHDGTRTEIFESYNMLDLPLLPPPLLGDMNCDGLVDTYDIDAFVLAITGQAAYEAAYEAAYPDCDHSLADMNGDGVVDTYDIDGFVAALSG